MHTLSRTLLATTLLPWAALALACPADSDPIVDDTATADAADDTTNDTATAGDAVAQADAAPDAPDTQAPLEEVRIVSLNLRCLIDDWDARLPILLAELAAFDPHLLGLQEVCAQQGVRDALTELVAGLEARTGRSYTTHRSVTHRAWDTYDEGLAVVSAWPLEATDVVALPTGAFPRKVLLTRVARPTGGALVFSTTHLDQQSVATRKRQAEAAVTALGAFSGAEEATVLTGDFNEAPTGGDVHAALAAAGLVDLWAALHPGEAGPTFPASAPTNRIDYVWLDAGASGLAGHAIARILATAVGGVTGSDHLGLAATLAR